MSNPRIPGDLVVTGGPGCRSSLIGRPLDPAQADELARVFKALSDPVRLRLLSLIASHAGGEACVCDVSEAFALSQPTISHHLKVLRETGLITGERRGSWVYYRVLPEALARLAEALVPSDDPLPRVGPSTGTAAAGAEALVVTS